MRPAARPGPPWARASTALLGRARRGLHAFSADPAADPANRIQVYRSRSADALLNLSVEHHLLRATPPGSTVLLLYANAPAVVFGRNQNPWLEADLARLAAPALGPVRLVRRRSGGGAVFHDAGNVNFSAICPPAAFDRDRYARLVVRALRALAAPAARVNARHDIVVDDDDAAAAAGGAFKVSGSAYKLTRLRSLHHGTCLLRSPNLGAISGLLRSPAAPFIRARGVESVRSPVRNLGLDCAAFEDAVVDQFRRMHGDVHLEAEYDEGALDVESIRSGYEELRSPDWTYGQTPRFTFSTHPFPEDPRPRPRLPFDTRLRFEARHGLIEDFDVQGASQRLDTRAVVGCELYRVRDWSDRLARAGLADSDAAKVGAWMNEVLGTKFTSA